MSNTKAIELVHAALDAIKAIDMIQSVTKFEFVDNEYIYMCTMHASLSTGYTYEECAHAIIFARVIHSYGITESSW